MYAYLTCNKVYAIGKLTDPVPFFRHLCDLTRGFDAAIGIGCYTPHINLVNFFSTLPRLVDVPRQYDFRDDPRTRVGSEALKVFYGLANPDNLRELSRLAETIRDPLQICDHVICFSQELPLFSFHDAFYGDELLIADSVPVRNVETFCAEIGTQFVLIPNPMLSGEQTR